MAEPDAAVCRTLTRVRYEEADAMGIAYYGVFLDWFTLGRSELLRSLGLPYRARFELQGIFLPVVEVRCAYRRSVPLDAEIVVETAIERLTPARLDFQYDVRLLPDGALAAEGRTLHAFVAADGRPFNVRRRDPELWAALESRAAPAGG